ncbi:MAG TPA: DNA-processing protein DprA [Feifaniaceae bacterium]|nr:DNA-processing protein DprA [Feifaniaceae bacterium]
MRQLNAEEQARLWLHYAVEYNARLFLRICERFPSLAAVKEAFDQKHPLFDSLSEKVRSRLQEAAAPGFIDRYTEKLEKKRISFTYPGEEHYPKLLAEISDYPSVLYYKGKLEPDPGLAIAIVGSRHPTPYGIETAKRFALSLAESGALIVSGLAEGIDACAARGALDCRNSSYPTVAVLGCGVDVIYPNANKNLYEEIIERGAIVSEFLPGARADRFHFPIRNRVMSGMAHGTLVVEAAERSGTSITAGYAQDQGRDVFAIPGRIGDEMSVGPNGMITRGEAKSVLSPEDILNEYSCLHVPAEVAPEVETVSVLTLSTEQQSICRALKNGEFSFDELCELLSLPIGVLNSCLTELQFLGIMKQLPGRMYALDTCRVKLKDN